MNKYIDAEKLVTIIEERKAQQNQWINRYHDAIDQGIFEELTEILSIIESLQQEQPMPDSTKLIELWHEDKEMLKEKDFRDDSWRLAYNAFMCGFGRGIAVNKQEQPDRYNRAMLEVKAKVDKLYDEASIGLNEYDSGFYNGIVETCMKLRGFIKARISSQEQPEVQVIQWTGHNLKEVIDFTGKSPKFGEWFKSWEEFESYVHSHGDILKLFSEDGSHFEVPVGAWIVKTPDGYNVPSVARFIHAKQEVDLEEELPPMTDDEVLGVCICDQFGNHRMTMKDVREIARHFYGLRNRALEEAARHVYESWMGGTMDDVRRDMVELGKVLNARKEE